MPHLRLNARNIVSLPGPSDGQKQVEYFDSASHTPGFGIRISAGGRRTWFLYYRRNGRLRWASLGTCPPRSLADARDDAAEALRKVQREDFDPAAAKRERKSALTFDQLADKFIEEYAKPRKRSWDDDARHLRTMFRPRWGRNPVVEVSRADVRDVMAEVAVKRGATISRRGYATLSKLFRWAVAQGHLDANPMAGLQKPGGESSRDRVLTDSEIVGFWRALAAAEERYQSAPADPKAIVPEVATWLRLRLLTAQRGGEVAAMEWAHLDLRNGTWEIPSRLMKQKRPHVVPLVPPVVRILKALRESAPEGAKHVFEGRRARSVRAGFTHAFELSDFRPHDLRRTAATGMAKLGVGRFIVARVLGHADPSVTGIYDRYEYLAEKREALTKWAEHVMALVAKSDAAILD